MAVVNLGDDVRTVRNKLGMEDADYHIVWRSLNVGVVALSVIEVGSITL